MSSWKDPEIAGVRALLASRQPAPGEPLPTRAERRAAMDAFGEMGSLPPGCLHEPAAIGGVKAERVVPINAVEGRRILYLHGGGYTGGSPRSHRPMVARLAEAARSAVVSLDYRLAPEHPFPAAVDDAVDAYRALLAEGVWPERMIVAGDSAGGGLALALALKLKDEGLPQPAGLFAISPWADLTQAHATYETKAADDPMLTRERLEEAAAEYLGSADAKNPLASPVFGDFSGVAPMLIQVGSEETLLGDSLLLAERAGHARVEVRLEVWPEMIHVWHAFGGQLGAARRAIRTAGAWMDERLGG
ncbi:MAG TPA: alpha/beta hydrolase [Phenylobacterium sp.]|jgi:monoterpene epsilon-lactone hydrolase|uniref:alpha/beta hydrolase n=1 Tax=Phenylobacterium sp. TaxID=1871053 RepID=UPI002BAE6AF3|nr:alpha/beta hydrolase [Phenylobacterium sp.]HXA39509.1 alpha/beta hydrolase [Phenylobacterium sp.]